MIDVRSPGRPGSGRPEPASYDAEAEWRAIAAVGDEELVRAWRARGVPEDQIPDFLARLRANQRRREARRADDPVGDGGGDFRRDARNVVWGMAFVGFLPALVVVIMVANGGAGDIRWDAVTYTLLGYSLGVTVLAFVAGIGCGRGRRWGRSLALVAAALLVLHFPLGTIFAVAAFVKLNEAGFLRALAAAPATDPD